MRVAIRVDASSKIGNGHFMRCLALADALGHCGGEVRFVCRSLPEHLQGLLERNGHGFTALDLEPLDGSSSELGSVNQLPDAKATIRALSGSCPDWVIVDHYALDAEWESPLRESTRNILVIDDLADRAHDCDLLLDPNLNSDADRYTGRVPPGCRLLLGPRYALLREEFRRLRQHVVARTGSVKRVLVFFGSADGDDYTARAVEAVAMLPIDDLHVDVVIGSSHPRATHIQSRCDSLGFECHVQTNRMGDLMAAADLSIGAGGSATWERCCLGLPTLSICTAENQWLQVAEAAKEGVLYAPEIRGDATAAIGRHLVALIENSSLRESISRNAMKAVDGRGALRVLGDLGCTGLEVRIANGADSGRLFEWRNHPTIRARSRNSEAISWEEHERWIASVLEDSAKCLLIGHRDGNSLGVVRFDIQGSKAEVSIYVVPGVSEPGLGRNLLLTAEQWLKVNRPDVVKLHANVLAGNGRSHSLFQGAEYRAESTGYEKRLQA